MKKTSFAALLLGTALSLPSCGPKPLPVKSPPPAIEQRAGNPAARADRRASITVGWAEGTCTVSHDGVVYTRNSGSRGERGKVEFFDPAIIPREESFVDVLPGERITAILTNKSLFFTVGWENAFSDKTTSPERPVVQDFFLKPYYVEDLMKKRILGWTANEQHEGFLLESGGVVHMLGVEGGKIRLSFHFDIPFEKKSVLAYHDGDLFIAHPDVYFIAGVRNAGKGGKTFTMALRKKLVQTPSFRVVSGVMVLVNGNESLPLLKNENGEYGKVLEPIR